MFGVWGHDFIDECDPSIAFLELYAVALSIKLWLKKFQNMRIILFCDNDGAVRMINRQSSRCRRCMNLIRIITLESLACNTRIFAKHVKGIHNGISDSLSRMDFNRFKRLTKDMDMEHYPDSLPFEMYPPRKMWFD